MTNEEAIEFLKQYINSEVYTDKCLTAHAMAISALQSVGKDITVPTKDDHFRDLTKMVPLTIEELRKMDGQPVWVEFEDKSGGLWGIVHISVFEQIVFPDGLHCSIGHPFYGKTYKAYAYPPAHIDREAWTAEWTVDEFGHKCSKCGEYLADEEYITKTPFCHNCGRAMIPEAWAELEKRLMG